MNVAIVLRERGHDLAGRPPTVAAFAIRRTAVVVQRVVVCRYTPVFCAGAGPLSKAAAPRTRTATHGDDAVTSCTPLFSAMLSGVLSSSSLLSTPSTLNSDTITHRHWSDSLPVASQLALPVDDGTHQRPRRLCVLLWQAWSNGNATLDCNNWKGTLPFPSLKPSTE